MKRTLWSMGEFDLQGMGKAIRYLPVALQLVAAQTANASGIDRSAESDEYLSSLKYRDHLVATLKGTSCKDAVFTFRIVARNAEPFQKTVRLSRFLECAETDLDSEHARWAMRHILNLAVTVQRAANRGFPPIGCFCRTTPLLDTLQKANGGVVCMATAVEASECVGFDAARGSFAAVVLGPE
jgi:hypothetical protein